MSDASSATADITQATLNVTGVTAANKVYDGTTTAARAGGSISAMIGDDVGHQR